VGQQADITTSAKVYELRIYTANEGKLPALDARFRDHTLRFFEKHGMENVFYSTVTEGTAADGETAKNLIVYILAHQSREAAAASWQAFLADPEWRAVAAQSEENGRLLAKAPVSIFMTPTEFSPALDLPNASSPVPARLFELRQYNTGPAGLPGTVDRFRAGEAALFPKHGMTPVGFWTATDNSAFIYLLAHADREAARTSWEGFFTEFRSFMAEYNAARGNNSGAARGGGRAVGAGGRGGGNDVRFLVPTDYSPRK
jgi:hypothetical protein